MRATDEINLGELNKLIGDIGKGFDDYKAENDARLVALGAGDESEAAERKAKLDKMDGHLTKLLKLKSEIDISYKAMMTRIEDLESRKGQPGATSPLDQTQAEYKTAFLTYMCSASPAHIMRRHESAQKMQTLAQQAKAQALALTDPMEIVHKMVNIGTGPEGGFAVPEEIATQIEQMEGKFSPFRRLVGVRQVSTSDFKQLVDEDGGDAAWAGEMTARVETAASTLRERTPTGGEIYAYPKASLFALEDMTVVKAQEWLVRSAARGFARREGDAVIRGDGSDKPTGMLNTTPVVTDDANSPLRAHAAYEFIQGTGSPPAIAADDMFDLIYSVNSEYRAQGTWIMNSLTTGAVRKLKDSNGQYHWQPGLQLGQPDRLLGYPVETWEQLDDINAQTFPIAFGDWQRAYVFVERIGLQLIRDEITTPGQVKFYIRKRVGGTVLNNDAAKWLRCP